MKAPPRQPDTGLYKPSMFFTPLGITMLSIAAPSNAHACIVTKLFGNSIDVKSVQQYAYDAIVCTPSVNTW